MALPRPKNIKLINEKEFEKNAKKVRESFEEKEKYLLERRLRNELNLSSNSYSHD